MVAKGELGAEGHQGPTPGHMRCQAHILRWEGLAELGDSSLPPSLWLVSLGVACQPRGGSSSVVWPGWECHLAG